MTAFVFILSNNYDRQIDNNTGNMPAKNGQQCENHGSQ